MTRDDDEPTDGWLMLDARDRRDLDPDRDFAADPADVEAERWEREMRRADVSRRDP